jgi:hypothetical protein
MRQRRKVQSTIRPKAKALSATACSLPEIPFHCVRTQENGDGSTLCEQQMEEATSYKYK